jgi:uncharacterized protein YhbP (UPF0306 family)
MSIATKDSRWPSNQIPFRFLANITDDMKNEIREAIKNWEDNTQIRFRNKSQSDDAFISFKRDDGIAGCGSSHVGYNGGEITIRLKETCDVKTVIHELAHAIGIHHEMKRPDRNEFVRILWDNINDDREHNFTKLNQNECVLFGNYDFESIMHYSKTAFSDNGEDTIVPVDASNSIRPSNRLTNGDIRLARRILPSNVHTHRIGSQGTVGTEISRFNWTNGWTSAKFYQCDNNKFLFLLKESDGSVHIHKIEQNEKIGNRIETENWTVGWTIVEFYIINGITYLFLLKESDGTMHIQKMKNNGTVGERVATENWTRGWSSAKFYKLGNSIFLFLLKESDGTVHIHKMRNDGNIGAKIEEYNWTSGWSNVEIYDVNGEKYLFLMKSSDGLVHIHKMKNDGSVGARLSTEDWTSGWTSSRFYIINNITGQILQ